MIDYEFIVEVIDHASLFVSMEEDKVDNLYSCLIWCPDLEPLTKYDVIFNYHGRKAYGTIHTSRKYPWVMFTVPKSIREL